MASGKVYQAAMDKAAEMGIDPVLAKSIWEAWRKYDSDGTGKLDLIEAKGILLKLLEEDGDSSEEINALFHKYDQSGDNAIDFGEFVGILQDISHQKDITIGALLIRLHLVDEIFVADPKFPKTQIMRYISTELEQMDACKQLIPTLVLFVLFITSFLLHEAPYVVHMQQQSIHFDLNENANFAFGGAIPFHTGRMGHKTLYDVNNHADFWSWMNIGLTPLIFHNSWDQNEVRSTVSLERCSSEADLLAEFGLTANNTDTKPIPSYCETDLASMPQTESEQGMYLFYHRILGGIRLQQELSEAEECAGTDGLRKLYGEPCYASPYYLDPEKPASFQRMTEKMNRPGGETHWFLIPQSLTDVRLKLKKLEEKQWLKPATQRIEVSFPTYNANPGTVTMTYIHILITRGGRMFKQVVMASVWLDIYHAGGGAILVDILWALMALRTFAMEGLEVFHVCRNLGVCKGLASYCHFWNIVDWISIAAALGIFICCVMQASMTSDLQADLETYDYTLLGGFNSEARTNELALKIEDTVLHARVTRLFFGFYAFVIGLRLFKSFAAQPRLALVTKTISKASIDIIHFGLVFFTTIAIYAASALALFGHELQEFSTYPRSYGATMRCILGDFEWEALEEVGRGLAGTWFWSFQIFVVNIMFNMLLAIVMDAYAAVAASTGSAETLWSQSYEIWRRWRGKVQGKRLGLDHVLKVLRGDPREEQQDEYTEMTASDLCQAVEGLKVAQANRLISGTSDMIKEEREGEINFEEVATEKLAILESRSKAIVKGVQIVIDSTNKGATNGASQASGKKGGLFKNLSFAPAKKAVSSGDCGLFGSTQARVNHTEIPHERAADRGTCCPGSTPPEPTFVPPKELASPQQVHGSIQVVDLRQQDSGMQSRFGQMEASFRAMEERFMQMEATFSRIEDALSGATGNTRNGQPRYTPTNAFLTPDGQTVSTNPGGGDSGKRPQPANPSYTQFHNFK